MAKRKTHTAEFEKLDNNEKATVAHMINLLKPESDIIELQKTILEEDLTPIKDEKILDHLNKIARGYMGEDVNFGVKRTGSGGQRKKLVENSINFEL